MCVFQGTVNGYNRSNQAEAFMGDDVAFNEGMKLIVVLEYHTDSC